MAITTASETFLWVPFFGPLSAWNCAEVLAGLLVAIGCIGEMYWLFVKGPPKEEWIRSKEFEEKRLKREKFFAIIVAVGVTSELICTGHNIHESIELQKTVEELRSTNLVLQSDVFAARQKTAELEKHILDVKLSMADRVLSERDIDEIERALAGLNSTNEPPKVMVLSVEGTEPGELAEQLRLIFQLGPNWGLFTNHVLEQFKTHIPNGVTVETLKRGGRTKGDIEAGKAVGHCEALASELIKELNSRTHAGATNRNVWQEDDIKNGNGNAWKFEPLWMVVWVGSKLNPPL